MEIQPGTGEGAGQRGRNRPDRLRQQRLGVGGRDRDQQAGDQQAGDAEQAAAADAGGRRDASVECAGRQLEAAV